MKKQIQKVTLDTLSDKVDKLASKMEAGFEYLSGKMDKGFKKLEEDIESLATMTAQRFENTPTKDDLKNFATKEDIKSVRTDLARLEQGQENIQLRVDSLAPQFEVSSLERRVKRLEEKTGLRTPIRN
jgi:hypothetical protein